MNVADTCMVLRLPTLVNANRPAFSLGKQEEKTIHNQKALFWTIIITSVHIYE